MKKSSFVVSFLLLTAVFIVPLSVSAAESPSVKPGSFFYGFVTTFEKINLFFTFNQEKKAEKAMKYAEKRLAEAEAVAGDKNSDAVKTAISGYENNIAIASEASKKVKDETKAENLLNLIAGNASKHQEILSDVLSKVPDEAKEAITKAIEASRKGQEEATKQIAGLKNEVEQLKKEVIKLKEKEEAKNTKQSQTVNTIPVTKVNNTVSKPAQTTTVKLSSLDKVIDALISNSEANITYAKDTIESTEFYDNNFSNAKSLTIMLNNSETDIVLKEMYAAVIQGMDDEMAYNKNVRDYCLAIIKEMENESSYLKKEKENNLLSNPVSTERYLSYYKELNTNTIEQYRTQLIKNYDNFVSKTKKFQSALSLAKVLMDSRADANYRAQISAINSERESLRTNSISQPTYTNYQPVVYPTIQMPQTTHCTISGDSVGLQAYVNCTTSSF